MINPTGGKKIWARSLAESSARFALNSEVLNGFAYHSSALYISKENLAAEYFILNNKLYLKMFVLTLFCGFAQIHFSLASCHFSAKTYFEI